MSWWAVAVEMDRGLAHSNSYIGCGEIREQEVLRIITRYLSLSNWELTSALCWMGKPRGGANPEVEMKGSLNFEGTFRHSNTDVK